MTNRCLARMQGWTLVGLMVLGLSLVGILPAQAIPMTYSLTGGVTGSFSADLSAPTSSFIDWGLTFPIGTFTNIDGGIISNVNLALFQTSANGMISFVAQPSLDAYTGTYTAWAGLPGGAGVLTGTYGTASVPEPSALILLGIGLMGLVWWSRKHAA